MEAEVLGVVAASQEVMQESAAPQVVQVEGGGEQASGLEERARIQVGRLERAFLVRALH